MGKLVIAGVLFMAPIVGVLAVNPTATKDCLENAQVWLKKQFPDPPKAKKKSPPVQRG